MNLNRLTHKSQEGLQAAQEMASSRAHPEVGTIHLLMAFLEQEQGVLPRILTRLGVSSQVLQQELEKQASRKGHPLWRAGHAAYGCRSPRTPFQGRSIC
ncbi:MAG: Clp protease N-terminal domain-containing protein [Candidatus Latescibacterota bacterium]|nr:Clp protease N-terminal domain-containing protein [Candidatus Latescibacterota bacterium]